jgi:hypothetical protein
MTTRRDLIAAGLAATTMVASRAPARGTASANDICFGARFLGGRMDRGGLQEGSIRSNMDHFRTELRPSPDGGMPERVGEILLDAA